MAHLVSFRGQLKLGASQALPRRAHNLTMLAADDKSRCQLIITSHSFGDHALFLCICQTIFDAFPGALRQGNTLRQRQIDGFLRDLLGRHGEKLTQALLSCKCIRRLWACPDSLPRREKPHAEHAANTCSEIWSQE